MYLAPRASRSSPNVAAQQPASTWDFAIHRELTSSPLSCFHCDRGVETFQVDPTTGKMTDVPNSFFFITNTEVGDVQSLAITH
jgi:hypothetical protein